MADTLKDREHLCMH